ncbi:MAG: hypothetical protein ABEK36_04605 [Candidatus Aenigmatarchaeota archaeon]
MVWLDNRVEENTFIRRKDVIEMIENEIERLSNIDGNPMAIVQRKVCLDTLKQKLKGDKDEM